MEAWAVLKEAGPLAVLAAGVVVLWVKSNIHEKMCAEWRAELRGDMKTILSRLDSGGQKIAVLEDRGQRE